MISRFNECYNTTFARIGRQMLRSTISHEIIQILQKTRSFSIGPPTISIFHTSQSRSVIFASFVVVLLCKITDGWRVSLEVDSDSLGMDSSQHCQSQLTLVLLHDWFPYYGLTERKVFIIQPINLDKVPVLTDDKQFGQFEQPRPMWHVSALSLYVLLLSQFL